MHEQNLSMLGMTHNNYRNCIMYKVTEEIDMEMKFLHVPVCS